MNVIISQFYRAVDMVRGVDGALDAIRTNNIQALKRQLNNELSPDACDDIHCSLLETSIRTKCIAISALLAYWGADLNHAFLINYPDKKEQQTVTDHIFVSDYYCESLVKFFMTYNAQYGHKKLKPHYSNPFFDAALLYQTERYALYDAEQLAKEKFEQENYEHAKECFLIAVEWLNKFILEEEEKLVYQNTHQLVSQENRTHEDIIIYYRARHDGCLTKIAECEANLSHAVVGDITAPASGDSECLLEERAGLRHRTPFTP